MYVILGYEPDSVPATLQRFEQHLDPTDLAAFGSVIERCRVTGGPFCSGLHVVDAQGRRKTVQVVGQVDLNGAGSAPMAAHGYLADVTASSRAETAAALRAALAHRAAIDQVKGMLMVLHGLDADAAFEFLVSQSSVTNVKVHTIADGVVERLRDRSSTESISREEFDALLHEAARPPQRSLL